MVKKIQYIFILLKVCVDLGIKNIFLVLLYRAWVKSSFIKYVFPNYKFTFEGAMFLETRKKINIPSKNKREIIETANSIMNGYFLYYSEHKN